MNLKDFLHHLHYEAYRLVTEEGASQEDQYRSVALETDMSSGPGLSQIVEPEKPLSDMNSSRTDPREASSRRVMNPINAKEYYIADAGNKSKLTDVIRDVFVFRAIAMAAFLSTSADLSCVVGTEVGKRIVNFV